VTASSPLPFISACESIQRSDGSCARRTAAAQEVGGNGRRRLVSLDVSRGRLMGA